MSNDRPEPGYKQTEVGIIPEDWDVKQLRTALRTSPQYGINAASVPYQGGLPTYIRITDISEDGYFKPEKLVSVKHSSASQYFLEKGDLVFARTGASVGKSYLYRPQDGRLVYAGFLIKVQPDKTILLPSFLSQYVNTKAYWNWVQLMSMRSGQPGINGNEYGQLLLPVPKLEEQRSIAQALSDVDALIAALDKAIAKKRAIKTATMQQLLTGKKRLPGFGEGKGYQQTEVGVIPEDWDVDRLINLTQLARPISYGIVQTGQPIPNGIKCIRVLDIVNGKIAVGNLITTSQKISDAYKRTTLIPGDLVIALRGKIGELAVIQKDLQGANLTRGVALIALKDNHFSHFYHQYLSSLGSKVRLQNSLNGSALQEISIATLRNFPVAIPTIDEQRAIATVLSDMDAEIAALETRLAKTQALKQGMMQQLLTGRVRLV